MLTTYWKHTVCLYVSICVCVCVACVYGACVNVCRCVYVASRRTRLLEACMLATWLHNQCVDVGIYARIACMCLPCLNALYERDACQFHVCMNVIARMRL
jgi:hypothetical protein